MDIEQFELILYVADQVVARDFYRVLLAREPRVDIPGMTEFVVTSGVTLGLMPERGIERIISPPLPRPAHGAGIPRCELYLRCADKFIGWFCS